MSEPATPNIRLLSAFARIAGCATLVAGALIAVGYWPTEAQAGAAGVRAMFVGVGIALAGSWAGSAPSIAYLNRPPQQHPIGILAGLAVRFGVTIGLSLAAWLADILPQTPLLLWIGIAQFVLLGVDVLGLIGLLKRGWQGRDMKWLAASLEQSPEPRDPAPHLRAGRLYAPEQPYHHAARGSGPAGVLPAAFCEDAGRYGRGRPTGPDRVGQRHRGAVCSPADARCPTGARPLHRPIHALHLVRLLLRADL